jgi:hypothetical protein
MFIQIKLITLHASRQIVITLTEELVIVLTNSPSIDHNDIDEEDF